ncbi:hypothetical protein [Nocardia acidivorans]|uniref:hypothetical protein n=1 Tax=Nocardia acidivorans TaxID=404580 RepID=UPI00082A1DAC|nr:hypothetical protein [Nocardia acidivorans]
MVWFADVALKIGQRVPLPDTVRFMYGRGEVGPARRHVEGWGVLVELPAVIQTLDLVAAGELDLQDVRAALAKVAAAMERTELDAHEAENGETLTPELLRCQGDCPRCLANYDTIRVRHAESARRRARALDPGLYPVAVTNSTVHRVTCREVARTHRSPRFDSDTDDDDMFRHEVKSFTHRGITYELPHAPLTADEYDRWRAERTGPHGGLKYRLCKICDPAVPLA